MKAFIIKENDSGQRLDKFLSKAVPKLPKNLLYKYIRLKRIKVNGKRADIKYNLVVGDKLELYINDEFFSENTNLSFLSAPSSIDIVYEDANILLADKKSGLVVHEDNDNSVDTLINRCLHYLYDKKEYNPDDELSFTPALCNRIDRNTGGIVIVAKNAESLRVLNEKIKNRELQKHYLCVCSGHISPPHATLKDFLVRNENESVVKIFKNPQKNGKTVITEYKVLAQSKENSLLEVILHTGRTHQIRAHLAFYGHPLLGDGKYGRNEVNRKYGVNRQLLYSYKLRFEMSGEETILSYLNHKEFEVKDVWFKDCFKEKS